ncbi:unnamed protein product [Malus baccata var. baccata]
MSPVRLSVAAKSQPRSQDLGGLGRSVITKLKSNPNPKLQGNQKQDEEGKKVISGGGCAFCHAESCGQEKRTERHREEEGLDEYGSVRPLCVKREWGSKLDELGKRLQELSSMAI